MTLHELLNALLDQIDADEDTGGLLSRETLKRASALRHAYTKHQFVQGQRVKATTEEYRTGGVVLAVFPMFPEQGAPLMAAVRHSADEGFFVCTYKLHELTSTDRTV